MKLNPIYIALILIVIITIFISCFLGRSVYEGIDETTKGTEPPANEPPANEPPANEPPANEPPRPASPPEVMGAVTGALNSISDAASRVPELNKTDKKTQNSTDIDDLSITNSEADKIIKWIETSKDNMKTNKVSLNKPITHSHTKTISSPPIVSPPNVSQETVQPASSDKGGVGGHQSYSQYNEPSVKRRREIPPGDDDLYILKSQIVPPVCPACPANISCGKSEPPQPCPACARCPEPAFDCKKVPNYRSGDARNLPKPVLNDFSSFGM